MNELVGEIPPRENKRGGPGWWLDPEGVWRAPADWPEDYPPLDGWVRDADGSWGPQRIAEVETPTNTGNPSETARHDQGERLSDSTSATITLERPEPPKRSRQAESDVRAMMLVGGALAAGVLLILMALVLQSRAGASAEAEAAVEVLPEVVFAAETEELRAQRRYEATLAAPGAAREQLAALTVAEMVDATEPSTFDESRWVPSTGECLDVTELVLLSRTTAAIVWADNLECVPSEGRWFDPYLGIEISRTIDAEVISTVPFEVVASSGGSEWTPTTRALFLNDHAHPATLVVLAADSGHNPRNATPDVWRPASEATWCGYAVDWVAVKARWELSVTEAERVALDEMLDTCANPDTNGPHQHSMVIDPLEPPVIERLDNG